MAGKNRNSFIWIIIGVVFAILVGGTLAGWWNPFGEEGICANPNGCQCGVFSTCGRGQTCTMSIPGTLGSCSE